MVKLLPILIVIVFGEFAFGDPPDLVPYTHVQEKEVKSFITIGMDGEKVLKQYGPPNLTDTGKDGLEVWQYLVDPRVVRNTNSRYAGFEVFLKDKKVTDLGIIHAKTNGE